MRNQKHKGIILSKNTLGEKDYALTILTTDLGKIRAIAKGARNIKSKFTGHLDILNICDFEIYSNSFTKIVTECSINQNFPTFRDDLKKFYFASLISRILKKYTQEDEDCTNIFELAVYSLESIEQFDKSELIYEAFKIKFCELLGVLPNVDELKNIEHMHFDDNMRKIINFMQKERFSNISKLKLDKKHSEDLKKATQYILEYSF